MVEIEGEWVCRSHMECLFHDDWQVLDDVSIYLCKYIYSQLAQSVDRKTTVNDTSTIEIPIQKSFSAKR